MVIIDALSIEGQPLPPPLPHPLPRVDKGITTGFKCTTRCGINKWQTLTSPLSKPTFPSRPMEDVEKYYRSSDVSHEGLRLVAATLPAIPSRRLRPAGPRPPGQVERPTGRTTWTRRARSGCLWCAAGERVRLGIPEPPGSRAGSPGRRRPGPGRRAGGPARRRHPTVRRRTVGCGTWTRLRWLANPRYAPRCRCRCAGVRGGRGGRPARRHDRSGRRGVPAAAADRPVRVRRPLGGHPEQGDEPGRGPRPRCPPGWSPVPVAELAAHWPVAVNLLAGSLLGAWAGASWAIRMRTATLYKVLAA